MTIHILHAGDDEVLALLAASDTYMATLYPADSNHMESAQALTRPNLHFVGCRIDGVLAGCGAVKVCDGVPAYGEVKRLFVVQGQRGQGLARHLMQHLEEHLLAGGIGWARLETGVRQPEAIGLYRKLGYVERPPFGHYGLDPLSIFMEKKLA